MVQPFSHLYQTLKGNPRLYDTLDKANNSVVDLQGQVNSINQKIDNLVVPTPVLTLTQSTPTLSLNIIYQNTTTKPVFYCISISIPKSAVVQLQCDTVNPPAVVIAQLSGLITTNDSMIIPFFFIIVPGRYFRLKTSGTGTATITNEVSWT